MRACKKTVRFPDIARAYLSERMVCPEYQAQVARVAAACGEVSVTRVNAYLQSRSTQVETITLKNERGHLLTLWKYGYHSGMLEAMPRGVLRVKVRRRPTKAWTRDELRRLLAHAADQRGRFTRSGAPVDLFLSSWLLLGYETGARLGDLFAFSKSNLKGDSLAWTQAKTGDPMVRVLSASCRNSVNGMLELSPDGRILGWVVTPRQATRVMKSVITKAGLTGTSKWLRRSGATHCEMEQPGAGRLHLGHRSPALFEQAYCDWAQLRTRTPVVAELCLKDEHHAVDAR